MAIGVFGAVGFLVGGCSSSGGTGEDGPFPPASRFGAEAIPCEETQTFYSTACCEVPVGRIVVQECWVVGSTPDVADLITTIRDAFAPDQDPEDRAEPGFQYWMDGTTFAECAVGGIVSSDPYTVVSVTARPAYSSEEMALLLQGERVEAEVVEVYIRVTEMGSAIDQWQSDMEGTHID